MDEAHRGLAVQLLRGGPLLALALVCLWALAARCRRRLQTSAAGAAVALAAAGIVHLILVPAHWEEGQPSGVFFATAGAAELALGGALLWRGASRQAFVAVSLLVAGLVGLYIESRLWVPPFGRDREAVDALGLVTKALEASALVLLVAGTRPRRPLRVPLETLGAVAALALAVLLPPLVDLGPSLPQLASALAGSLGVMALFPNTRRPSDLPLALSDAAALALLLRAPGVVAYLVAGLVTALVRSLGRANTRVPLAPVGIALLSVLAVPPLAARLEVLHVGHGAPGPSLVAFVTGGVLAVVSWQRGRLPCVVAFYAGHLGLQALRVALGRTSIEAVEIPAASIGLVLLATFALVGEGAPRGIAAVVCSAIGGTLDVALRDLGLPYAGVASVTAASALASAWVALRVPIQRPSPLGPPGPPPSRTARSSPGRPAAT